MPAVPSLDISLPFDLQLDLVAFVHVVAATAVTVHVLLRKRDVRAAIGWIGLAWLSPIAGPALYYVFGINRVTRRAARLTLGRQTAASANSAGLPGQAPLPENILTIARVSQRVTAHPLAEGNALSLLRGGDEAYPAMLAAIEGAERSIALASYIFRLDPVGRAFIAALREARRRGVEIRVLIDGIGSGYPLSATARALARAGIPVARFMFHWLPWRMPFLNMRNHKKLLIIDGRVGFSGGLNIGAENTGAAPIGRRVEDVQFRAEGPVVAQLMLTFAEDWDFITGEILRGEAWWPEIAPRGSSRARGISSGPDEDLRKLESILASAVAAARERIRIVTPYFLPDQRISTSIELAALRGVAVEIVLPERTDHPWLDWAMRAHLEFLALPGVNLYASPAPFDHSKLVTVDGSWCALGSANWDVRSLRLNFEFMLECYGADTASAVDRLIDAKIARARMLSALGRRPLPARLRNAAARLMLPYL
ncbi:MAG TPA: phospholipase D-like domain-containing protein [Stellaceae bacterium]|nr:phospholipase D-like domain-containing protein [Stellaceae bacterium]